MDDKTIQNDLGKQMKWSEVVERYPNMWVAISNYKTSPYVTLEWVCTFEDRDEMMLKLAEEKKTVLWKLTSYNVGDFVL